MDINYLYLIFSIAWLIEFYLFGMQRASLLISRTSEVDWQTVGVHLLPTWYPITWVIRLLKWGSLGAIFWYAGWQAGLVAFIASFLLSTFLPIPYKTLYSKLFHKRVNQISDSDLEAGSFLKELLHNANF